MAEVNIVSNKSLNFEKSEGKENAEGSTSPRPTLPSSEMWEMNALFIPEEHTRIDFGLYLHQPVEIALEALDPMHFPCPIALISILVNPQIQVPIIKECYSRVLRHKGHHVMVEFPR
ncbi:hypothetical protein BT93_E0616 [Corymbia citriodora subsp. variegata]|nr:hypothetical protein BT93_E0616 [Corymbia citriodora subsp. variegata]